MTNEQKIAQYDQPLNLVFEDTRVSFSDIVYYGIIANLVLGSVSMFGIIAIALRLAL